MKASEKEPHAGVDGAVYITFHDFLAKGKGTCATGPWKRYI